MKWSVAAVFVCASAAQAQPAPDPSPPPTMGQQLRGAAGYAFQEAMEDAILPHYFVRAGPELTGFAGTLARNVNVGPGWGVWGGVDVLQSILVEAGYSGSLQTTASGARYFREGGQLTAGVFIPLPVEPFVELGLALTGYSTLGGVTSGLPGGFSVGLPFIAGVRMRLVDEHLVLDLRGTYVLEGLAPIGLTHRWSVGLTAGYRWQ